jgi:ATP-dependent Lhr-like helicase
MGKALSDEERIVRRVRQLLSRYGVMTRAALQNEGDQWRWGELYPRLRIMEMRGEVRRGYFVEGLAGLQFALPDVIEEIRYAAKPSEPGEPVLIVNSCDPANLFGPLDVGGPMMVTGQMLQFSRRPSTYLAVRHGWPVLVAEGAGTTLTVAQDTDDETTRQALRALRERLSTAGTGRITVRKWNGERVVGSPGQLLLESVGAVRGYDGMEWERS